MPADYATGFQGVEEELTDELLAVEGTIPEWLDGSLVRNGPGTFEAGGETVDHWFDGLAMLRKFTFDAGTVRYSNRYLRTDAYEQAQRGEFDGGFATGESTLRGRIKSFLFADTYDNTNIIAERLGDRYFALTETPRWIEFDPETLETIGDFEYTGPAPSGQLACGHLQADPATGELVNFEVEFGRTSQYHVYAMTAPEDRRPIASVSADEVAYMHSFALTPSYVVLTEFPFVVNPLVFFKPGRQPPFIEHFEWQPARGTRFIVIDRSTGEVIAEPRTDAYFGFHHVNAFEDDDELVIDLETVPDAEAVETLYLDDLESGLDTPAASIRRFRIDLSGPPRITVDPIYEGGTALPTVSPDARLRPYRFVYSQSTDEHVTDWPDSLLKIDVETGAVREFSVPDAHCSEPIFVPRPDSTDEDDGVVLSVMLDTAAEASWLLVLDGATFEERARARLPHRLPYDFHGRFFPELTA